MTSDHPTDHETGLTRLRRSLDLLWGRTGKDRPARGPKRGLTLQQIVVTAVALADREGLAALSMRRVAAELGVGTMSLYRYVPGKDELVALMVDHVQDPAGDEPDTPAHQDWTGLLETFAERTWELYTGHAWLIQVNTARPVIGPRSMAWLDRALVALEGLPLSGQEKIAVLTGLEHLVLGAARTHVLHHQAAQHSGVSDKEFWSTQEPYMVRGMEEGAFPRLAGLPEDSFAGDAVEALRFAVRALLDGFRRLVEERTAD
ncbi:TetR/AcrR family transcriptional regulator [Streptomyces sp. enrichment culture]|uniref:TetR/AcrR family transcriptional regulator n=1 Tax=Streptomyces sp. enrichment culture TaxID=1795815 RepID=UPI003F57701C